MSQNRKTYGRVDIGRVEMEGGWYDGESWTIEAHCGYWPLVKRICLVYIQVAKLCLSVSIRLGDKEAERAGTPVMPKSSAKEVAAAQEIIRQNGQCNGVSCDYCPIGQDKCQLITPSGPVEARMMPWADAARAWLAERGIPIEAPAGEEAAQ